MELQYVDDNVIAAHSAEDLQGILNAFNIILTLWRPRSYINLHLTS